MADYEWPVIRESLAALYREGLISEEDWDYLYLMNRQSTSLAAAVWKDSIDTRLRSLLAEAITNGDSRLEWQERLKSVMSIANYQAETLGRTMVHRAQQDGQDAILSDPDIAELYPYRAFYKTLDNRIRDRHRDFIVPLKSPVIYHVKSPSFDIAATFIREWMCRCSIQPLQEDEAIAMGIDDDRKKSGKASVQGIEPTTLETTPSAPKRRSKAKA